MRGSHVCSASMKHTLAPDRGAVDDPRGQADPQALLQGAAGVHAAHAPEGIELDDLSVLGPIFVLKVKT